MVERRGKHVDLPWVVVVCLLACGAETVTGPGADGPITVDYHPALTGFAARLDTLRVGLRIPGMTAALGHDGAIIWTQGFGEVDVAAGRPATGRTPFHLASLTKPFGATILMQLMEQGLVGLDDPVSQYGVNLSSPGTIRVRHLLTHTSEGVPGSAYAYNGNRFGYLDRVIEQASGRTFESHLEEQILGPLGLEDTAPNPRDPEAFAVTGMDLDAFEGRMAAGYALQSGRITRMDHPDYFGVSAGLVASAEDMVRFSMAIDEGRFLEAGTWSQVFTPAVSNSGETLPYGLGWFILEHEGVTLQWHYGHWTTNSSLIVRVPEDDLTFVVVANTPQLSAAYGLGGDNNVLRSAVARLFVETYVLGDEPLPGGAR
jgi:CubicO group peptidase (beta-lactamase class C family)